MPRSPLHRAEPALTWPSWALLALRRLVAVGVAVVLLAVAAAAVVSRWPVDRSDAAVCGALAPPELTLAHAQVVVLGRVGEAPDPLWGLVRSNTWVVDGVALRGRAPHDGVSGTTRPPVCGYPAPTPGDLVLAASEPGEPSLAFSCRRLDRRQLVAYGAADLASVACLRPAAR